MNRITKLFALGAFALAGLAGAATAQASAANFSVPIVAKDGDTVSMIRTTTSGTITGFTTPAAAIAGGAVDPGSGTATYSDALPTIGHHAQGSVTYALASDGVSSPCTFTITVSKDTNPTMPYLVQFSNNGASRCTVPSDARSTNGVFGGSFTLSWSR